MNAKLTVLFMALTIAWASAMACSPERVAPDDTPEETPEEPELIDGDNVTDPQSVTAMAKSNGHRYAWDPASEKKISTKGGYSRVIKLNNGTYLAAIESGGVSVSDSKDGETWSAARTPIPGKNVTVDGSTVRLNACNAEAIELSDGTVILGANYRPATGGIAPYAIAVARSTDHGKTFSAPQVIYEAGLTSADGCWEPAFLELPDGTVQCYFANEGPYTSSNEQEISMLSSSDKGVTWTKETVQVCFRAKRRDGMPVPRIIGDEIVVSIEDNGRGKLQPALVRCKVSDNWSTPVLGNSANRNFAFADDVFASTVYMGAPYLLELPGGATMISYQSTYNRTDNWELSCMEVAIGDATARNFGNTSRPFSVANDKHGLWNSIMLWDNHTVLAVSSSNKDGSAAVWGKKARLMYEYELGPQTQNEPYFYVAGKTQPEKLLAGIGYADGKYLVRADVTDSKLFAGTQQSDGIWIYLDVVDKGYAKPYAGTYRIWVNYDATVVTISEGNNGKWEDIRLRGVEAKSTLTDAGYVLDISMDKDIFKHANGKTVRAAFQLSTVTSEYNTAKTIMSGADASKPATWLKMTL